MRLIGLWLGFVTLAAGGCLPLKHNSEEREILDLELVQALPVNTPGDLEPSGLVAWNGSLFTVADKIDDTIYRVEFQNGEARLVPHLKFSAPSPGNLDLEGITADPSGNFYLVSESYGRILRVEPTGQAEWYSPDFRLEGRNKGLFQKVNAGLEGITWLGPDHWLAAVEREPRGLIEWRLNGNQSTVMAFPMEDSPFKKALPLLRLSDYSALASSGDATYALFRNAHLLVKLDNLNGMWRETAAWSYRHIETNPEWAFISQTHGQAEGLAIVEQDLYLIFDNNLHGRQANPSDRRPLLVQARFPGTH